MEDEVSAALIRLSRYAGMHARGRPQDACTHVMLIRACVRAQTPTNDTAGLYYKAESSLKPIAC